MASWIILSANSAPWRRSPVAKDSSSAARRPNDAAAMANGRRMTNERYASEVNRGTKYTNINAIRLHSDLPVIKELPVRIHEEKYFEAEFENLEGMQQFE